MPNAEPEYIEGHDEKEGYVHLGVGLENAVEVKAKPEPLFFGGVRVFEINLGKKGSPFALPGIGIFVNNGDYSQGKDMNRVYHEFGHILQAALMGKMFYYGNVARFSISNNIEYGYKYMYTWPETTANILAYYTLGKPKWNFNYYPIK